MASTTDDAISFTISAEDLTSVGVKSAKKNLGELETAHGTMAKNGKMAFWMLGEAAENAAESLGVPNQMSRQLGNTVESLTLSLGKGAFALGSIGIVAYGLYSVYDHLIEQKKRQTEETIKGAEAAGDWITAALKDKAKTEELTSAKKALAEVQFDLNKQKIEEGIKAQTKAIEDLVKEYNKVRELQGLTEGGEASAQSLLSTWIFSSKSSRDKALTEMQGNINLAVSKLRELRAEAALYTPNAKDSLNEDTKALEAYNKALIESRKGMREYATAAADAFYNNKENQYGPYTADYSVYEAARQADLNNESSYLTARASLYQVAGATIQEQYNADVAAFQAVTDAKLNSMNDVDQKDEYLRERAMERMKLDIQYQQKEVAQKKSLYQQDYKNKQAVLGGIEDLAQAAYEASGEQLKAFFYIARAARAGETYMHYSAAAAAAYAEQNYPMGAFFTGMSYTMPALIMAQAFGEASSSSSSSSSGTDTYSDASSGTSSTTSDTSSTEEGKTGPTTVIVNISTLDSSKETMDRIMEDSIVPALQRAADRNIVVTYK